MHSSPPGSYLICPVCFWEDDHLQLRWPRYAGGANKVALMDAQRSFTSIGAKQPERLHLVRPPRDDEPVDDGFRPIDPAVDHFEETFVEEAAWPADRTQLYWWRPTFWRRPPRDSR